MDGVATSSREIPGTWPTLPMALSSSLRTPFTPSSSVTVPSPSITSDHSLTFSDAPHSSQCSVGTPSLNPPASLMIKVLFSKSYKKSKTEAKWLGQDHMSGRWLSQLSLETRPKLWNHRLHYQYSISPEVMYGLRSSMLFFFSYLLCKFFVWVFSETNLYLIWYFHCLQN